MGKRKLGKKLNKKNKKRKRNRPPRIFKTKDGRYYFKKRVRVKGKYKYRRVYIKSKLKNSELVKIIINNFQKKNRRLRSAINKNPNAKQRNGVNNPGIFSYGSSLDSGKQSPELVAKNALIDAIKNDKDKEYIKRIQDAARGLTYTPMNGLTYTPSKNTKQQEDDTYDMEIYDAPTHGEITNANIKYAVEPYEGETYTEKYRRMLKNAALLEGYDPEESQIIADNAIKMNQIMTEEIKRQSVEAALKENEIERIKKELANLENLAKESKEKEKRDLRQVKDKSVRKRIKEESKKERSEIGTVKGDLYKQMEEIIKSFPVINSLPPTKGTKKKITTKQATPKTETKQAMPQTMSIPPKTESKQSKPQKPQDQQAIDKQKEYDAFLQQLNTNKLRTILSEVNKELYEKKKAKKLGFRDVIQHMYAPEIYPLLYAHMLTLDPDNSDIFRKKLLKQLPKKSINKKEFKLLIPEDTPTTTVTTPIVGDFEFTGPSSKSKPSQSLSEPSQPLKAAPRSQSLTAVGPSLRASDKRPKTKKVRSKSSTTSPVITTTQDVIPLEDDEEGEGDEEEGDEEEGDGYNTDDLIGSVDIPSSEDDEPQKPDDTDLISDGLIKGEGKGKNKRGMTDRDIDRIMKKHSWYVGTFSLDEFPYIPIRKTPFSFIINTKNRNEPKIGHWVSIRIDPKDSIEYFDPLAEDPPNQIRKGIKNMINRIQPDVYLKFKINKIKHQAENTDTCGFHCIAELKNRSNGIDWKECTGWSEVRKSEKDVKKMKKKYGYI